MTPPIKLEDLLSSAQISNRDGKPILSPNKSEEISAITRYASQHNLAIEITGAGTKRSWGNPVTADILLDTTHLTGVISHSWQDLTATVAAGTPWATMQRVLSQHNQQVALDPLWPETATIGGIIATNDSGPMRLKYGSLRDLIIGMTIVLADGTIAKSGGKVVKNVAGYDLHKLMTGAFGTLGIITEVTFRLHPIPQHPQTFTVSAPQATQLAPLIQTISDSHLLTEGLQLRGDTNGFHIDIQLNAHPDARQSDILHEMTEAAGLELSQPLAPASQIAYLRDDGGSSGLQAAETCLPEQKGFSPGSLVDVWHAREALLAQPDRLTLKATMLPTEVAAFALEVKEKGGESVSQSLGIMYAAFPADELSYKLAEEFRYHVGIQGGTTLLLARSPSTIGAETWAIVTEGELPNAIPLMREIKRRFDPNRTLNPGRFLGGI
jgi:glycolate oxidase FAD binding subunit